MPNPIFKPRVITLYENIDKILVELNELNVSDTLMLKTENRIISSKQEINALLLFTENFIPSCILCLNLKFIPLHAFTQKNRLGIFANIPPHIKTLILSSNSMHQINEKDTIELFKELPNTLKEIMIDGDYPLIHGSQLIDLINNMPLSIEKFNLDSLGYASKNFIDVINAVLTRFNHLKVLELYKNSICIPSIQDFIYLLNNLPQSIETLSINYNAFLNTQKRKEKFMNASNEFKKVLEENLPLSLHDRPTEFVVSIHKTGEDLLKNLIILSELKSMRLFLKIKNLDDIPSESSTYICWDNRAIMENFYQLFGDESLLPNNIELLDLSHNDFGDVKFQFLQQIMSHLPLNLQHLDLRDTGLAQRKEDLTVIFKKLPKSLVSLDLRKNKFTLSQIEQIKTFLEAVPVHFSLTYVHVDTSETDQTAISKSKVLKRNQNIKESLQHIYSVFFFIHQSQDPQSGRMPYPLYVYTQHLDVLLTQGIPQNLVKDLKEKIKQKYNEPDLCIKRIIKNEKESVKNKITPVTMNEKSQAIYSKITHCTFYPSGIAVADTNSTKDTTIGDDQISVNGIS